MALMILSATTVHAYPGPRRATAGGIVAAGRTNRAGIVREPGPTTVTPGPSSNAATENVWRGGECAMAAGTVEMGEMN